MLPISFHGTLTRLGSAEELNDFCDIFFFHVNPLCYSLYTDLFFLVFGEQWFLSSILSVPSIRTLTRLGSTGKLSDFCDILSFDIYSLHCSLFRNFFLIVIGEQWLFSFYPTLYPFPTMRTPVRLGSAEELNDFCDIFSFDINPLHCSLFRGFFFLVFGEQ